ncbi:MAG: hypothetical protein HZC15_01900 [Candidatus Omnitrophica bacterium]|nr:hypothetical protein [Candidatus Omnitrophota bacterium]
MADLRMVRKFKVAIMGKGRIAQALVHYLNKSKIPTCSNISGSNLIIGALGGDFGEDCLKAALRYKKNLLDVSDVDPPFYLKNKHQIKKSGITVIPGCGFSPGLVNLIIGRELEKNPGIKKIEISAGSLSQKKNYFPFLWCFEDLILGHKLSSFQLVGGKKKKFAPLAGLRKENFFGIKSESYLSASGIENLFTGRGLTDFCYRVVRPDGFNNFLRFLINQGFLDKDNFSVTKKILEEKKQDNISFASINLSGLGKEVSWLIKSFSRGNETLNSMQKITSVVPVIIASFLREDRINKGLIFMEELGKDEVLFSDLIKQARKEGIVLRRLSKND